MSSGAIDPMSMRRTLPFAGSIEHAGIRALTLAIVLLLTAMSAASYFQADFAKSAWAWRDQEITYKFAGAYLLAFAGSLLWIAVTGELAAFAGVAVTVLTNAIGTLVFLVYQSIQESRGDLVPNIVVMLLLAIVSIAVFRWSRGLASRRVIPTPRVLFIAMIVFTVVLLSASVRLILQHTNVFPWDPRAEWSTMIGLSLLGSVAFFAYGAYRREWTHAGAQFAGFLAYDLVLIFPYIRMLRDGDGERSVYGASGTQVNEGPLVIFLIAIGSSALLAVWYLFFDARTRVRIRSTTRG
jgi:hypothetical protein